MPADLQLKTHIERILRGAFPSDTVDVSDGFQDNVHVVVVSRQFDGMREKEKQDMLWSLIESGGLTDVEKVKISMILPYSPGELK